MPTTTNIYKVKKGNKVSDQIFTLKKAREICKRFGKKGIEAKPIIYKENVIVKDITPDGEIIYFMEYNEQV